MHSLEGFSKQSVWEIPIFIDDFKVNRSVYIANRTYRFCLMCKKYQYEKRV